MRYITFYCFDQLKRKDLDDVEKSALFMEARDLFRKSPTSGQPGEMLIYFLLESVLCAPQGFRKMPLTTNPGEERKGSDGVHIKWNPELEVLDIFFAESKVRANFTEALTDTFVTLEKFHAGGMKQHELNLFSTHFKLLDSDLQMKILSYIEGENASKSRLNQASLIGFEWEEYKCLDDSRRRQFLLEFKQRYSEWGREALTKTESHLATFRHKYLRFEFFFVPFKNVQQFRDWFEQALRG